MADITVKIHKDRFPKPIQGLKNFMQKIGSKSPITVEFEKKASSLKLLVLDPLPTMTPEQVEEIMIKAREAVKQVVEQEITADDEIS